LLFVGFWTNEMQADGSGSDSGFGYDEVRPDVGLSQRMIDEMIAEYDAKKEAERADYDYDWEGDVDYDAEYPLHGEDSPAAAPGCSVSSSSASSSSPSSSTTTSTSGSNQTSLALHSSNNSSALDYSSSPEALAEHDSADPPEHDPAVPSVLPDAVASTSPGAPAGHDSAVPPSGPGFIGPVLPAQKVLPPGEGPFRSSIIRSCSDYPNNDCSHSPRCYPQSAEFNRKRKRTARCEAKAAGAPAPPGCGVGKEGKRVRKNEHVRKLDKKIRGLNKKDRQHRREKSNMQAAMKAAGVSQSAAGRGRGVGRGGGGHSGGGGNRSWVRGK
jgi:hypothetical protein